MSARRSKSQGYTLMEVIAALGVLAVGAGGVIALQKATLINSVNARNIAVANTIAATWAERLRTDALEWNDPNSGPDLNQTEWLDLTLSTPFPNRVAPTEVVQRGSPDADKFGTDLFIADPDPTAFCTQLRFLQFSDTNSNNPWPSLIRTEIRVFWERSGVPADCTIDPILVDTRPDRFGAVYLTTAFLRNTSPE